MNYPHETSFGNRILIFVSEGASSSQFACLKAEKQPTMPETVYLTALDSSGLNWLRFELQTEAGQVTTFVAQFETTLEGRIVPVVRYDNHHGFCHRDKLNRRGEVVEKTVIDGSPAQVASLGVNDIKANWRAYRRQFLGSSE